MQYRILKEKLHYTTHTSMYVRAINRLHKHDNSTIVSIYTNMDHTIKPVTYMGIYNNFKKLLIKCRIRKSASCP